jgi:hypothetical protein
MNLRQKKERWFADGAVSFASIRPEEASEPLYPCPICLVRFPRAALDDDRLTAEDVPPKSIGGRPLLLTCKSCNNDSGMSIDADAKDYEDVRKALAGKTTRRVTAIVGGQRVRGVVDIATGRFVALKNINPPGTAEYLKRTATKGTIFDVDFGERPRLGTNISWLKAGYLVLVAEYGFEIAFDPAMTIVRQQILENDERRMVTFLSEGPVDADVSARYICRYLEPSDLNGWLVRIGRFDLSYPLAGDMTFYDRLARYAGLSPMKKVRVMCIPRTARFGLPRRSNVATIS